MDWIPARFAQTIVEVYGAEGSAWLRRLPALLADCAQRWSLTLHAPFALSYNYVAPAVRPDGTQVVLKVGMPTPALLNEIAALQQYNGQGSARLLDADPAWGVLLLERLIPGTPLLSVADDERATLIAAQVMRRLWKPAPANPVFPSVGEWAARLQQARTQFPASSGPLPPKLLDAAERLFAELLASMATPVLLHGDLHHGNILAAERQPWLALDPKGVVGEPAYEVGALLRNPLPQLLARPQPQRVLARRIELLAAELELDPQRMIGWGVAQAVLSAWWGYEDHGVVWHDTLMIAELLLPLLD